MDKELFYLNHEGIKIDLLNPPIMLVSDTFANYDWSYETTEQGRNDRIVDFFREIQGTEETIRILGKDEEELKAAMNAFYECTLSDVQAKTPGKLFYNGWYLPCFVRGSKKTFWRMGWGYCESTIEIVSDNPVWIRELTKDFLPGGSRRDSGAGLSYPYDYPYDYATSEAGNASWTTYSPGPANFELTIFGPCVDPRISINGHPYEVFDTVEKGEYVVVNSRQKTVVKHRTNSTVASLFHLRGMENDVFQPIEGDTIRFRWNGYFGFTLKLFEERSEPKW